MTIGLKQVSRVAGVSIQTASDILNCGRHKRYDPQTQQRVHAAARQQGYQPHRLGRMMRTRRTGVVAFVAKNFENARLAHYSVYPFLVGLSHKLSTSGYHVGLVEVPELERGLPDNLRERFYDGLLIHWGLTAEFRALVPELNVPSVWWDAGLFASTNCLDRDETTVGRTVTERLIELGHQRIGFLVGSPGWENYRTSADRHYSFGQRFESYSAAVERAGQPVIPLTGHEVGPLADQLRTHDVSAVIVQGAGSLDLFRQAAWRLGWEVPRDLSVATCDFEPLLHPIETRIGGMSYDRYAAGQQAAVMMLSLVTQQRQEVSSARFTGEFSLGDTIGPAPDRGKKQP